MSIAQGADGPRRARRAPRGISYVEVLFAMFILSVGIVGAYGAVGSAALDIYYGGRETVVAERAQAILERMRNAGSYEDLLSYADIPPAGASSPRPSYVEANRAAWLAALQTTGPDGIGPAQGSIAITHLGVVPNRLAVITVSIDWPGRRGSAPPTFVTQVAEWP